jgi:hypothetical protein
MSISSAGGVRHRSGKRQAAKTTRSGSPQGCTAAQLAAWRRRMPRAAAAAAARTLRRRCGAMRTRAAAYLAMGWDAM